MTRSIISILVLCLAMFLHVAVMGDDCAYAVEMEEMKVSTDEARKYGVEISKSGVTNGCLILNVKCLGDIRKSYDGAQKLLFSKLYSARVCAGESVSHLAVPQEGDELSWQINLRNELLPSSAVILRYGYDEQYVQLVVDLAGVLSSEIANCETLPKTLEKKACENVVVGLPEGKNNAYVTSDRCVTNEIDGIVYTCKIDSYGAVVRRVELAKSSSSADGRDVLIPRTIGGSKVRAIAEKAFSSLPWLRSVTVCGSITQIGNEAFANCSNLVAVTVERDDDLIGLRGIRCFAFRNCVSLVDVSLTNTVSLSTIGRGAFEGCKSLKRMQLPSGCYHLGVFAFAGCENLLEVELPATIEEVCGAAFVGCSRLREIKTAPGGNYVFENGILYDKAKKKVIRCLIGNESESVRIEEGVAEIMDNAFSGCKHLKRVSLPSSLKCIEDFAFWNSGLKEVVLPKGLEGVGFAAFARTEVELEDRWKYAKED